MLAIVICTILGIQGKEGFRENLKSGFGCFGQNGSEVRRQTAMVEQNLRKD
jgi:hypothetical protein